MPVAEVDIYNLALSHVGNAKECQSTTENTAEANACRRYYAQTRDEILGEFAWPFARVVVALALVEADPTTEWGFAYRYPADCLTVRRILSDVRNDTRQSRVSYEIARDSEGLLIYTDRDDAVVEYTVAVDDTTQFPTMFVQAVAFKMGYYIAPRITGGDPYKLGTRAYQLYQQAMEQAADNAANEEQPDEPPESEFTRDR